MALTLTLLDGLFAVARLDPRAALPDWAAGDFTSVTRTENELSVVAADAHVPEDVRAERGFRAFRIEGPLPFDTVGVLASLAGPLAEAKISILAIATFDTDYVLVRETDLARAKEALGTRGFVLRG